jgi:Arc/MetJ-type ribon-helix-helix transcriptional regulator
MSTRNVELPPHQDGFIEDAVRSARESETMPAPPGRSEESEEEERAKIEWLRNAVQEGMDSIERGESTILRSRQELRNFLASLSARRRSAAR